MKTRTCFSILFLCIPLLIAGSAAAGDDDSKGAETIILEGGSTGSVTFPHGRHQGIFVDCKPCHDLFGKAAMAIERLKSEGKLPKKEVMDMCKNCHKEMIAQGKKTGPTSCKDCHKK
jgi:hypothetical protein